MSSPTDLSLGGSFAFAGESWIYFSAHHHFLAVDDIEAGGGDTVETYALEVVDYIGAFVTGVTSSMPS